MSATSSAPLLYTLRGRYAHPLLSVILDFIIKKGNNSAPLLTRVSSDIEQ